MAIRKRGIDERPGTHPPILAEEEYNAAFLAKERRRPPTAPQSGRSGSTCSGASCTATSAEPG